MNKFIITFLALLAMTSVAFRLRVRQPEGDRPELPEEVHACLEDGGTPEECGAPPRPEADRLQTRQPPSGEGEGEGEGPDCEGVVDHVEEAWEDDWEAFEAHCEANKPAARLQFRFRQPTGGEGPNWCRTAHICHELANAE